MSKMRLGGLVFAFTFVITLVFIWKFLYKEMYLQEGVKRAQSTDCVSPDCCPRKVCPAAHFPFFLRSGTANVVGPKICFNGKIIMSGIQNNVGRGVNIVKVDGETGEILKSNHFNSEGLLDFLKTIQEGNVVLVASYEDPAVQLTDEIRELFAGLGSSVIRSVKYRDSWVFAGEGGLSKKSPFEKLIVNDEKRNAYGDWPEMGELGGCFPRKV